MFQSIHTHTHIYIFKESRASFGRVVGVVNKRVAIVGSGAPWPHHARATGRDNMLLHRCTGKGRSAEAPPGRGTRSALAAHAPIAPFSLFLSPNEREKERERAGSSKKKRDAEFLTRRGKGREEKRRKGKEEETSCGKESRRMHSEREGEGEGERVQVEREGRERSKGVAVGKVVCAFEYLRGRTPVLPMQHGTGESHNRWKR